MAEVRALGKPSGKVKVDEFFLPHYAFFHAITFRATTRYCPGGSD